MFEGLKLMNILFFSLVCEKYFIVECLVVRFSVNNRLFFLVSENVKFGGIKDLFVLKIWNSDLWVKIVGFVILLLVLMIG